VGVARRRMPLLTWGGRMSNCRAAAGFLAVLSLFGGTAKAEEKKEPSAVVAIGPEGEWGFPGSRFSIGPSASVEFSIIEDWLEIEIGGGTLFSRGQKEWEADVLFKKPFTLSDAVELMVGAGPSWSYATGETGKTGATFVLVSCFGPGRNASSVGFLNLPIPTLSARIMRSR
jgi:hypothetical protein